MLTGNNQNTAYRAGTHTVSPRTDLVETPKHFLLQMDLPGVPGDRISIQMIDGKLIVTGTPNHDEAGKRKFLRHESDHAAFHRHFKVSEDAVDTTGITAHLKNGVLSVTLPKRRAGESRRRRIPVRRV
jgi:HSP20 family protein